MPPHGWQAKFFGYQHYEFNDAAEFLDQFDQLADEQNPLLFTLQQAWTPMVRNYGVPIVKNIN